MNIFKNNCKIVHLNKFKFDNQGVLISQFRGNLVMNMKEVLKIGTGVILSVAIAVATGCAANTPAFQCGKVDYKSMASCKAMKKSKRTGS